MPQSISTPLRTPPDECFVGNRPRRCSREQCRGVAILIDAPFTDPEVELDDIVHAHARRRYHCATCGEPAPRPRSLQCPCCNAWMKDTHPICPVCPPFSRAPAEPLAGWERAFLFDESSATPEEWGLSASSTWSRYGTPARAESRIALRFGSVDRDGANGKGTDDEPLSFDMDWTADRIASLSTAVKLVSVYIEIGVGAGKRRHVDTHDDRRAILLGISGGLINAIGERGGKYESVTGMAHVKRERTTPFASYRHALRAALGSIAPEQEAPGRGMGSLGRSGGVMYTNKLRGGILMQKEGMSVRPSHSGASVSSTSRGSREDDAKSCLFAARAGGVWLPVVFGDDGIPLPGCAARVADGRPLTRVELKLLELCELGRIADDDDAKINVGEALRRVKAERIGSELAYPEARHLQPDEAKSMVRKARVASLEAFEAWGLIERQERAPVKDRASERAERGRSVTLLEPTRGVGLQ